MRNKHAHKKRQPISLSAILVLTVTGLVTVLAGSSILAYVRMYEQSLTQTAQVNSQQAVAQVSRILATYGAELQSKIDLAAQKLDTFATDDERQRYFDTMTECNSDLVTVMMYDNKGKLIGVGGKRGTLKADLSANLSFSPSWFVAQQHDFVTKPHVQNLFWGEYPWVVTVAKRLYSQKLGQQVCVAMDLQFSAMAAYLDKVSIGQHGYCFLMDDAGQVLYHPQQQLLFSGIKQEQTALVDKLGQGSHIQNNTIYTISPVEGTSWRVVGVSFLEELVNKKVQEAVVTIGLISLGVVLLALCLIVFFSRLITGQVHRLIAAMGAFEQDAAAFRFRPVHGVKEIAALSDSFDHMATQIQNLMEQVRKEEITLRKTELKALQAQINPHFLYNTLDSIQWMCEQGRSQEAVKMVGALAALFRISISKGNELIPLERELNHALSYLIIQSFRYQDKFTYRFEVEEGLNDFLVNKITLQPMIENAIYHGVGDMADDEDGEIVILAKSDGDNLLLQVRDNGVGMTKEQCEGILLRERSDSGGIGIKNVNDRIRIYFGEPYGVKVESVLDEGTTISILLPKLKEEDANATI